MPAYGRGGRVHLRFERLAAEGADLDQIFFHDARQFRFRAVNFDVPINFPRKRRHRMYRRLALFKQQKGGLVIHHVVVAFENAAVVGRIFQIPQNVFLRERSLCKISRGPDVLCIQLLRIICAVLFTRAIGAERLRILGRVLLFKIAERTVGIDGNAFFADQIAQDVHIVAHFARTWDCFLRCFAKVPGHSCAPDDNSRRFRWRGR